MLQLLVADIDICRISKILGRHRLKSSITYSTIIIDTDEIPQNVVDMLFANATIVGAQNYQHEDSDTSDYVETKSENDDESANTSDVEESESNHASETNVEGDTISDIPHESDGKSGESSTETGCDEVHESKEDMPVKEPTHIIESEDEFIDSEYYMECSDNNLEDFGIESKKQNSTAKNKVPKSEMVYRGEVYKWGSIREDDDDEGKIKECVIIIQNDYQNSASDDTIALFCTSHYEERAPISFSFQLTEATMIDHSANRLKFFDHCTFFVGRIKGISRKDLGKYLGTMNDMFMNTLQPTVDFCLGLKRSRTVNWAQLKILSTVKMEDLFKISESKVSDKRKVEEFLELFGFDMTFNGVEYVKEAILIASKLGDYRLEYLAETIAKRQNVDANEVLRLIVARIKENFHFNKSPAISFVRLIDRLLKKG